MQGATSCALNAGETNMAGKLNDDRVTKVKSEYELNQEALMQAVTDIASACRTVSDACKVISEKIDKNHQDTIKWMRAGRFTG